jgi:hypothetical protein
LLGTAVAPAISPVFAGFDQGSGEDPIVGPPGPFFAIWGLLSALPISVSLASGIGVRVFKGQAAFVLGVGWALLGVLVSTVGAGATALSVIAGPGLAAVPLNATLARRSCRRGFA